MRSTTMLTAGLPSCGCSRNFCAAQPISSDLPLPWKCQIRPFFGKPRTTRATILPFVLMVVVTPRPPPLDGHADGTIAEQVALSGKREDLGYEHGRHVLLVDLVDLVGPIEPGDGTARGRLGLADDQRQAIDHEHHAEALLHCAGLKGPLVGDGKSVVGGRGGVHQAYRYMLALVPKGMVFSPRSQAMKISLARTSPSTPTESMHARRL